jgi:hypothetical protein
MQTNIQQITSREYKLILNAKLLKGNGQDRDLGLMCLKELLDKHGLIFDESSEEGEKTVWYLDTNKHELRHNGFILRLKEKTSNKKCDVTFKTRDIDKDKALTYNIENINPSVSSEFEVEKKKFEEDIMPERTMYSLSTELEYKKDPKFSSWSEVTRIFPQLKMDIAPDSQLTIVNGLKPLETKYKLGKISLKGIKIAGCEFSRWLIKAEGEACYLAEFDLDIDLKNLRENPEMASLNADDQVVKILDKLFDDLKVQDIFDPQGITKTEFIYKFKKCPQ